MWINRQSNIDIFTFLGGAAPMQGHFFLGGGGDFVH